MEQLEITQAVTIEEKVISKSYLTVRVSNTTQLPAEQALN
jgi:hypothetical protein